MPHADPLDVANDLAQGYNDQGVDAVRRAAAPEQQRNEDGTWPITQCVDCDEDIPSMRLAFGRIRCVTCQGILEERRRRGL